MTKLITTHSPWEYSKSTFTDELGNPVVESINDKPLAFRPKPREPRWLKLFPISWLKS